LLNDKKGLPITFYSSNASEQRLFNCQIEAGSALANNKTWSITPKCLYLVVLSTVFMSTVPGQMPVWRVDVMPRFSPLSPKGEQWYRDMVSFLPAMNEKYNVSLALKGFGADAVDTVDFARRVFAPVVFIVSIILFAVLSLLFMSIGIPLRVVFIVFVAAATTFGCTNMIFAQGALWWFPMKSLQGSEHALSWLMPFATLLLVIGISLFFDLTMVLCVQQFHDHGYSTKDAVVLAASEIGNEITVSAVMMMVLFAGLLFSEVPAMNQLGFFFFMTALLQGIVFRLFLSTTMLALFGEWTWFPFNILRRPTCGGAVHRGSSDEEEDILGENDNGTDAEQSSYGATGPRESTGGSTYGATGPRDSSGGEAMRQ
jgi:hypothetical protein